MRMRKRGGPLGPFSREIILSKLIALLVLRYINISFLNCYLSGDIDR